MDCFKIKINTIFLIKEFRGGRGEGTFSSIREKIRMRRDQMDGEHIMDEHSTVLTKKPNKKALGML